MPGELVCVSGGSGFIATHCILQLIQKGYRVRTTLRSLSRKDRVVAALASAGATDADKIDFVAGDLTHDDGWNAAVKDCKYVLHVASPFPDYAVKDENELIIPARDGTLRVMKAAKAAGVQRVVVSICAREAS
jgi:nucleoside-diphosphate-sugar epimerase